ncbi:bifunctional glycosyltransferase/CDP-glycerol:glycerophosphate glycerophosphotransferase [Knoellia sp. p5-6-4]|uniref:bifunctional glycosyltransferase/CDP-glycerol:glycerophosphate glycerophosphotransferase n=1 Tax=unclassified Knoellia TaxID=2618719 RepID=UPI0023D9B447|nr:bifunctional glycosyltransferase/CDP-glycerol:glycerophosphate glycerophosphotransferase [Knoellia sp. p5-6-4]MDF2146473.1 CDP-glycerol glycerophosphotransferase family protein [Knoellia sp. p5-6-4]
MPLLSVVVPIYNVSDYLVACLESLVAQTLGDLEVILVDDGSTDGSGQMADEFAAGRPSWRVLHVDNGGLGRARNIGMDASTSEFVAFVDSDDLIPRDAYELMLHAVRESGSDIVCGGVLRFDGARTFTSPLHRRAITRTQMRTHIHQTPSLVFDSTAWNKVYRRSFLVEHGLRFPEGVYYEDIPLTLPAHFLAKSVDVLADPVYLWRERQTAVLSITQRRAETKNLVDRMAAVSSVDDFLTERGDTAGKEIHDRKVLTVDIPLFLDVLHEGTAEFQEQVISLVGDYLRRVPAASIARMPPIRRLQYHLIQRGMLSELIELHEYYRIPANRGLFVRSGLRMYADLPFRKDPALGVPDSVYDVTRSQPLRTGVRDVAWEDGDLVVDGHAFIHRVPEATRASSLRRFQLRRLDGGSGRRQSIPGKRVHRPDLTARTTGALLSYDAAGFRVRVPARALRLEPGEQQGRFELLAQVATPAARRGSSIGNPDLGPGRHPRRSLVAPGQIAIPGYEGRRLVVTVRRAEGLLESVEHVGDAVRFRVRGTDGPLRDTGLYLRRTDALTGVMVPLVDDGECSTATVSADVLEVRSSSLGDREWVVELTRADARPGDGPRSPLDMAPQMDDVFITMRGRSIEVRQSAEYGVTVRDTRPGPVLTSFAWQPDGLCLEGVTNGPVPRSLSLSSGSGTTHTIPVHSAGDTWRAVVPALGEPGSACLRWLAPGRWFWSVTTEDEGQRQRAVRSSSTAEHRLGEQGRVDGLTYLMRASPDHDLQLAVDASGDFRDRGALHRERNRKYFYRVQRRLPLEDTIFFESWKGNQYSDSPRAVFEELQRRGDPRECVWAVANHGVEVPEGVATVVTGSREYYRRLARARWVVSNDSMPVHYVKRKGSRYAQTWHGTPLKRVGFDIETLQMSNRDYLKQFARDVAKWDILVSPNAFSTDILRRAFRYGGEILEIGYPRNDIFHRPELREQQAAATRARLGLPEGKRVILYAPTWRDNDYSAAGRYQFTMKLDLERLHRAFGDDSVLLIRGHQLVSSGIDSSMFGGFVRNVSGYPDIRDLYLVADVLVTDYSSVMFDFVNTGRPLLFFTWDLEEYRDNLRGFYFDFEAEAPGPLLTETSGVIDALQRLDAVGQEYAERYQAFRDRFTGLEDGRSAERFIERFL